LALIGLTALKFHLTNCGYTIKDWQLVVEWWGRNGQSHRDGIPGAIEYSLEDETFKVSLSGSNLQSVITCLRRIDRKMDFSAAKRRENQTKRVAGYDDGHPANEPFATHGDAGKKQAGVSLHQQEPQMNKPTPKISKELQQLLPCLSISERTALETDIEINGVRHAIIIDEDGNILDGMHRFQIDPKCRTIVQRGLTWPQKKAFTLRSNLHRRNLSPDQKADVREKQKVLAAELAEEGQTQEQIGATLGVDRATVSRWIDGSNVRLHNTSKPDARVKMNAAAKQEAVERVEKGEKAGASRSRLRRHGSNHSQGGEEGQRKGRAPS
jgi:DNA-binding NarL/FixJ family response regulator